MFKVLASAALAFAVSAPTLAQTFSNSAPITVIDGGETTSSISVSGVAGNIIGLSITLSGLSHSYPDDLVFGLLNESLGLGFVFFSGVGGSTDISDVTITFSDFASNFAPESFVGGALTSGTYLPSNYGAYEFTFFDNATAFADFNGYSPNGTWTLYVDDVFPEDDGSIAGGFSLTFTTDAAAVPEPASWMMMIGGFGIVGAGLRRRRKVVFA